MVEWGGWRWGECGGGRVEVGGGGRRWRWEGGGGKVEVREGGERYSTSSEVANTYLLFGLSCLLCCGGELLEPLFCLMEFLCVCVRAHVCVCNCACIRLCMCECWYLPFPLLQQLHVIHHRLWTAVEFAALPPVAPVCERDKGENEGLVVVDVLVLTSSFALTTS